MSTRSTMKVNLGALDAANSETRWLQKNLIYIP
jgi:hypothetical protein